MSRKATRVPVTLHSEAGQHTYLTTKNRRTTPGRLTLRKYDPRLRRHVTYREAR
jgi:large subunit ribosomal protein L33